MGWAVYRAEKSQRWPGTAALEVALLWTGHPAKRERRILDGDRVAGITPSLDPQSRMRGNPYRLAANEGQSFQGSIVLGTGFILEPEEAHDLIAKDSRNKAVLFPYLNGEDLNSRWDCSASRWVINFHDWPIERAMEYPACFDVVERMVKPQRLAQNDRYGREYWWRFLRTRPELYRAISDLDRVLVIAQTSRTQLPTLVPQAQVYDQKLVIFPASLLTDLSFRTSSFQYCWTVKQSSTMKADTVYAPSDCCDTLAQPHAITRMKSAGENLDSFRRDVMVRRRLGLTALYNLVHDVAVRDKDVVRLREIHVDIDEAVREAYALDEDKEPAIRIFEIEKASERLPGWSEIELGHGFHETRQGARFTISAQARTDVLDKLLALNHYRYDQEVKQGLHSGKRRGASKKSAGRTPSGTVPAMDDGGLFPPEGTLF